MSVQFRGSILTPRSDMQAPTTIGRMVRAIHDFGVHSLSGERLSEGWLLASNLIRHRIASRDTMAWVNEKTSLGLLGITEAQLDGHDTGGVDHSPIVGLLGIVPMTPSGLEAVLSDGFNAVDPDPDHVCDQEDEPAALFGWGVAVARHEAARLMVNLGGLIGEHIVPKLDWYGRAVTSDGERLLMQSLGWEEVAGTKIGTIWNPSYEKSQIMKAMGSAA